MSNNHKGSVFCIIANVHPINSTECSKIDTEVKERNRLIVQSADMHVSATYAYISAACYCAGPPHDFLPGVGL